ncbi:hypothetical protein [Arthrobacter sp. W4I7]|uniref:hypothetical protein n=1 Tax=Arthrobacter sp. W4I7 TaxID=3042296 RepID=UPI0027891E6F|nr:hypothetical protein [Arthrobacter sp. W4I7]MDQ0689852.1 hypothetical protein [Arthrobacter sp. W4I7]
MAEGWQVSVSEFVHLQFHQPGADGTLTRRGYVGYASGNILWDTNVVGANLTTGGQVIATGLISTAGAALKITGNSTPASSADAVGTTGEIRKDDNYVYMNTSTGWKRSALTTR